MSQSCGAAFWDAFRRKNTIVPEEAKVTIMSMEETALKALSADQQKNVLVIRYENLVEQTNKAEHFR